MVLSAVSSATFLRVGVVVTMTAFSAEEWFRFRSGRTNTKDFKSLIGAQHERESGKQKPSSSLVVVLIILA